MRLYYRFTRACCQFLYVSFFRGRVYGLHHVPASGGVLLVSNHQSFLDPVLITLALHREGNYMARDTLFASPLFRRLIESLNAFPIKRASADVGALKEIIRRLKDGRVVVTFPEGTRTQDGSIGPLLEGSIVVAKRAGCAIVPTVIEGAFKAWPRTAKLPHPAPIRVMYDRPILPSQSAKMEVADLTRHVRERMLEMQARLRRMTWPD